MTPHEAMRQYTAINERILRELLGRWVSELEPVIVVRRGDGLIIGLALEGCATPSIWNEQARIDDMRHSLLRSVF
jgi:hypothetical protein